MLNQRRIISIIALGLSWAAGVMLVWQPSRVEADFAPDWLRAAAQDSLPKYPEDTVAVTLLSEQQTIVKENGDIETRYRRAYKLLRPEARDQYGSILGRFDNETKLLFLKAWTITSTGEQLELKEKDAAESGMTSYDLYCWSNGHYCKYFPSDPKLRAKTTGTWNDIGIWYAGLTSGSRDATPAIKQKVAELTAGISDPVGRMKALTSYMQRQVRYVAIEIGTGGYQPHPAAAVFDHQYGDCKDKATLLSAMLHEIGIESYYVLIDVERGIVNPDFPSTRFNHAILAIRLPENVTNPSLFAVVRRESETSPLINLLPIRANSESSVVVNFSWSHPVNPASTR
jgi:hypothetical protein